MVDSLKTSSSNRKIVIPKEIVNLLLEYKLTQNELQYINGDRWINSDFVFTQEDGSPMHPDSVTTYLARFSKRYDLKHISPHKFRHSMASILYFSGADAVSISKRLGHSRVSTTSDIYAHIIQSADETNSDILSSAFLGKKNNPTDK